MFAVAPSEPDPKKYQEQKRGRGRNRDAASIDARAETGTQLVLTQESVSQISRMLLKCDQAHRLLTRDFGQLFVAKNGSGLVNQRSHRHKQLNRECVCSHFNKPVTIRSRSALKTSEAA